MGKHPGLIDRYSQPESLHHLIAGTSPGPNCHRRVQYTLGSAVQKRSQVRAASKKSASAMSTQWAAAVARTAAATSATLPSPVDTLRR